MASLYLTNQPSLPVSHRRVPPPCWSQEETAALIDVYCNIWYSLQLGNLRANHWQEVSDDVADRCPVSSGNPRKTSTQCRHKMEKLKKRYRGEVSRSAVRNGQPYLSSWVHFKQMEMLEKGSLYSDPAVDPDHDEEEEKTNLNSIHKRLYNPNENGFRVPDYPLLKQGYGLRGDFNNSRFEIAANQGGVGGQRREVVADDDPAVELVAAIKRLEDVYIRTEKMRMDTVKEVELMRMEMDMKRTESSLELQERLMDSFSNGGLEEKKKKKIKRM